MSSADWNRELNRMLNAVEEHSAQSFGIIKHHLNHPLDDEFQNYAMKMAKIR